MKTWWQVYYIENGVPKCFGFCTRDGIVIDAPDYRWKKKPVDRTWFTSRSAKVVEIISIKDN